MNYAAITQLMLAYNKPLAYKDRPFGGVAVSARHVLYRLGLVRRIGVGHDAVLECTEKGRVFCEMILATPLPVEAPVVPQVRWQDPREAK